MSLEERRKRRASQDTHEEDLATGAEGLGVGGKFWGWDAGGYRKRSWNITDVGRWHWCWMPPGDMHGRNYHLAPA